MLNSFPDCPLVPLLTASNWDIQLFRSCTVESVCTLHLCVATQETLHHKFNPCAAVDSIPCSEGKINQNVILYLLSYAQSLSSRYQCRKFHLQLHRYFSEKLWGNYMYRSQTVRQLLHPALPEALPLLFQSCPFSESEALSGRYRWAWLKAYLLLRRW